MKLWILVVLVHGHLESVWAFADKAACERVQFSAGKMFEYPYGCVEAKLWVDRPVWRLP